MSKILNISTKKNEEEDKNHFEELAQLHKSRRANKDAKPVFTIEFSWKFILFVLGIVALIFWAKQILSVSVFLFLSVVIMSAILPVIRWLGKKGISKNTAIVIAYSVGVILLLAIIALIVIPFINQIDNLAASIPVWIENITANISEIKIGDILINSETVNDAFAKWFSELASADNFKSIASTLGGVVGWVSLTLASIVFSVYLVLEHNKILDFGLLRITSDEKRVRVKKLVLDLESKLGRWLLGQASISTIAGISLGTIVALFRVPFALPMGVFIALLSAIPTLGATVASIPPILLALITKGPLSAFILTLIFLIYQQIENNYLIPKIMGSAAGVKPIVVLFFAMTFMILFGVWGAVLSVPAIVITRILYEFFIDLQKIDAKGSIN